MNATVSSDGRWKAFLRPTEASPPGTHYDITALHNGTKITLTNIVFGDVWFCAGQSNMWLPLKYTYAHNTSFKAIYTGKYDNLRIMAGDSQVNSLNPSSPPTFPWRTAKEALEVFYV